MDVEVLLAQEPDGAAPAEVGPQRVAMLRRDTRTTTPRGCFGDSPGRLDAVDARQPDVHHDDIRRSRRASSTASSPLSGLADHANSPSSKPRAAVGTTGWSSTISTC